MLTFKNIRNGKIVTIDHTEFDKTLLDLSNYVSKIFDIGNINTSEFKLLEINESSNNIYLILEHNETKSVFRCMLTNLKNSGIRSNDEKRVQVNNKIKMFKSNEPYFVIGLYNAGNKIIVTIAEISRFVANAIKGKSYSSFWVPLDLLIETYNSSRENVVFEKKGGYILNSITLNKLINSYNKNIFEVLVYNDKIRKLLKTVDGKTPQTIYNPPLTPPEEKIEEISIYTISKFKRDQNLRNYALERANYKCEICAKSNTFIDNNKKMYFEAHHIIPFHSEAQKNFLKSLDHISNLVCLCPECHRKIHHSDKDTINEMLLKLLLKRKDLIERYELVDKKKISSLLNFYLSNEGKEDE